MKLLVFRHFWGLDLPWSEAFPRIQAAGYPGIETVLPPVEREAEFCELLRSHGFEWICQAVTTAGGPGECAVQLRAQVERAARIGARFVSAHAGRDAFDLDATSELFDASLKIEADVGLAIAHETHRGRPLFTPWATLALLDRFPTLKLTCDLSHWVVVCERLLDGLEPILARVAEQAYHVHARVGYQEGPQVPDPRVPEYAGAVAAHERWWDQIWDSQQRRGMSETTLTPEFGPPHYMHTRPSDGAPVADLWDVVEWQTRRQRDRFARRG